MTAKKKTRAEIASEMTDIIVGHLEAMPTDERKQRLAAFKEALSHGGKREHARPKAASSSRSRGRSRRIPA